MHLHLASLQSQRAANRKANRPLPKKAVQAILATELLLRVQTMLMLMSKKGRPPTDCIAFVWERTMELQ